MIWSSSVKFATINKQQAVAATDSSWRALLTLSLSVVAKSLAWQLQCRDQFEKYCLIEFEQFRFKSLTTRSQSRTANRLEFLASTSYEWNSRTRTISDAFLTRASRSWFELIDFVKSHRCSKIKMNISIKFDLDTLQCKSLHQMLYQASLIERIIRFYYQQQEENHRCSRTSLSWREHDFERDAYRAASQDSLSLQKIEDIRRDNSQDVLRACLANRSR